MPYYSCIFFSLLHINWCDYGILVQDILKSKAVREKVDGIIGKVDTRIIKDGNFGAEDVLVEEESRQLIQEKESNYEINTVDDRLDDKQIKAPSERVRNVADEINIRTDKDKYYGSGEDMVIEEDNYHSHQEEEYNLQSNAKDNGLANIWNEMAVALECSKVFAFDFVYMMIKFSCILFINLAS